MRRSQQKPADEDAFTSRCGPPASRFARVVVMGPSGCGKSTVGKELAAKLEISFVDGDSLHPKRNVEKMASGHPLTDADRWPWLERIAARLNQSDVVIACSALKRAYRAYIVQACHQAKFIELNVPVPEIRKRMAMRKHFMPPALLDSQLAAWEHLGPDELGMTIANTSDITAVVDQAVKCFIKQGICRMPDGPAAARL